MSSQWPLLAARLVQLLPTLPGWTGVTVFRGAAVDVQTPMFATVGHATDGNTTNAGSFVKQLADDGVRYAEQGSIACQLATKEPGDLATIHTALLTLLDSLEAAIRTDRRLAVLSPEATCGLTVDLSSALATGSQSYASVAFSVDYTTIT